MASLAGLSGASCPPSSSWPLSRRALTPLLDAVELGLSAIVLWWASLPGLALTARVSAWVPAGWSQVASAAAEACWILPAPRTVRTPPGQQ